MAAFKARLSELVFYFKGVAPGKSQFCMSGKTAWKQQARCVRRRRLVDFNAMPITCIVKQHGITVDA